ncbi:MAG TPA: GAF domain-containing protein [Gemmatimonadaceae bacterium]|nr:GAF domain-containing protein [Gemmatimonadaceae bacterium]
MRRVDSLVEEVADDLRQIARSDASRDEKAQRIAEIIRERGNHRWVGIYDVGPTDISVIGWSGPAAPTFPTFPVEHGLNGAAVSTRKAVIANDVSRDPRYLTTLGGTRSEMVVPILLDNRVVGTVDVESDEINRFADADRQFIEACATAVAGLWR